LPANALSASTIESLQQKMKLYVEDILGLKMETAADNSKLDGVVQLLIRIRKESRAKKDYVTSDKIRNELQTLGIQLKDEKDGNISYTIN